MPTDTNDANRCTRISTRTMLHFYDRSMKHSFLNVG